MYIRHIKQNKTAKSLILITFSSYEWIIFIPSLLVCFNSKQQEDTSASIILNFFALINSIISSSIFRSFQFHSNFGKGNHFKLPLIEVFLVQIAILLQKQEDKGIRLSSQILFHFALLIKIWDSFRQVRFTHNQNFYQVCVILISIFVCSLDLEVYCSLRYFNFRYLTIAIIVPFVVTIIKLNSQLKQEQSLLSLNQSQSRKMNSIIYFQKLYKHKSGCMNTQCACQNTVERISEVQIKAISKSQLKNELEKNQINYFCYLSYLTMNEPNLNVTYSEFQRLQFKLRKSWSNIYERCLWKAQFNIFRKEIVKIQKQGTLFLIREINIMEKQWPKQRQAVLNYLASKISLWTRFKKGQIATFDHLHKDVAFIKLSESLCITNLSDLEKKLCKTFQYNNRNLGYFYLKYKFTLMQSTKCSFKELSTIFDEMVFVQKNESVNQSYLTSLDHLNNQATQLVVVISKENRGVVKRQSNKFLPQKIEIQNIYEIIPSKFQYIHDLLIEDYLSRGYILNNRINSHLVYNGIASNVDVTLSQLFENPASMDSNDLLMIANLKVEKTSSQAFSIILDPNLNVVGVTIIFLLILEQTLDIKLTSELYAQLDTFAIFPELEAIIQEFDANPQASKSLFERQSYFVLDNTRLFNSDKLLKQSVDIQRQGQSRKEQVILNKDDRKEAQLKLRKKIYVVMENQSNPITYFYYLLDVEILNQDLLKRLEECDYDGLIPNNKHNLLRLTEANDLAADQTSNQTREDFVQCGTTLMSNQYCLKLRLSSLVYFCFQIVVLCLMNFQIAERQSFQTQCFSELSYTSEFLDAYGRAMIASRHVIYMRDFNKFLKSSNIYSVNDSLGFINLTSVDKISFSLYVYRFSILDLIEHYQNNIDKLSIFEAKSTQIEMIRISSDYNSTEIQLVPNQATFYQIILSTLYMAIMSFARDPTLYLEGRTDTYAQVNTRSILYLNFNKVSQLTLDLMKVCRSENVLGNYILDQRMDIIVIVIYFILVFQILVLSFYILKIRNFQKAFYKIFIRTSSIEAAGELDVLELQLREIESTKIWIQNVDKSNAYYNTYTQPLTSKRYTVLESNRQNNISEQVQQGLTSSSWQIQMPDNKSEAKNKRQPKISHQLTNKQLFYSIIPLLLINIAFISSVQISYQSYTHDINPIVSGALKTFYDRLLFLDTINSWDVYINLKFYNAMIQISQSNPSQERFRIYSENIRHGRNLLKFIGVDEKRMELQLQELLNEPYSEIIYNLQSRNMERPLLSENLCYIDLFRCEMNETTFKGRVYTSKLTEYFDVGIIKLFQSTIRVILDNQFVNLTDPYEIVSLFEKIESSWEYFLYFLWGFDATLYQNKLFSEYFVNLSIENLTSRTESILLTINICGSLLILSQLLILIFLDRKITEIYQEALFSLKLIPQETIQRKKLQNQLHVLSTKNQ